MGPRLAPLALLLLALCGISSSAVTKPSSIPAPPGPIAAKYANAEAGSHSSVFWAAYTTGATLSTDEKKAIENGVLCAFADPNLAASMKKEIYGAASPDAAFEWKLARIFFGFTYTGCDDATIDEPTKAKDEFKCVCTAKNLAVFCAAEKIKKALPGGAKPTSCPKEELAKIKAGSDVLADYLDFTVLVADATKQQAALDQEAETDVAKLSVGDAAKAKFYCAAIDPTVVAAVEALRPIDFVYMKTAEDDYNSNNAAASDTCKDDAKKKTWFGECMCAQNKMEHFCIFHAQAQYFKEEGYLSCCKGDEKFITAKMPTVKFGKDNAKKTPPVETPACATAAPPAPATNETTTPSGSTTTFSLLAPTTALLAAAALLRH